MSDADIEAGLKILSIIEMAIGEWSKLKAGTVKAEDVLSKLNGFTQAISDNDRKADASVDEKFPPQ